VPHAQEISSLPPQCAARTMYRESAAISTPEYRTQKSFEIRGNREKMSAIQAKFT